MVITNINVQKKNYIFPSKFNVTGIKENMEFSFKVRRDRLITP